MKTLTSFIGLVILITACSLKNSTDDCIGVIDFIGPPSFQLTFVDADSNNLIENQYYKSEDISASINGQSYDPAVFILDDERFQNIVLLPSGVGNEGQNRWLLILSEMETDTLDFSLVATEVRDDGFCGTFTEVTTVAYNGNSIDLETSLDEESYTFSIIVNKTIE